MKLNKSQWQLDFKSSIIIPCIIAITLITILLFIFPSIRYSALFSAQAENYSQNIIRQTNLGISQSLHQFETKVKNLIDDPEIRNFIISNESTDDFQYSFQNIIESYFQVNSLDAYYLEGLDLYLLHKKGSLHYGYKNTSLSDIQTSPYYRNALIYPTNLNWLPYNQKEECLELSMCIYNYTDYSLEGIVVIRLSQSFLLDKFQNLNIINADCMYILNENRQIICSTDISLLGNVFDGFELSTNACGSYSSAGKLYSYADMRSAVPAISYYVLIIVGRMSTQTQELQSLMKQLQDRIYQFFHTTVSVGISNLHSNYEALHTAYTESLRALGKQFFTGNQCIHFFLDQNSEDELGYTDYHTLYLYQKKIETSIATYQGVYLHQQASSLFYEWVSVFNKNVSLIKSSFIVLSVLSINSIIGSDKQQTALLFEKYANFQKVIRCDTLEMLKDIFVNMIIDLSDFRSIKTSTKQDIVNKITDYISNHYMEQLSLSTVAKSVFLSPSYLSSLITGETGKNFTDIVNEIRISKSIELLKNPKMRIADIAYSVGFNEPQYFSSIFKKCTNLTPRDYRDFYLSSVTERK